MKIKVLVCEQNDIMRKMFESIFTSSTCDLRLVETGTAAYVSIAHFSEVNYSLLVINLEAKDNNRDSIEIALYFWRFNPKAKIIFTYQSYLPSENRKMIDDFAAIGQRIKSTIPHPDYFMMELPTEFLATLRDTVSDIRSNIRG